MIDDATIRRQLLDVRQAVPLGKVELGSLDRPGVSAIWCRLEGIADLAEATSHVLPPLLYVGAEGGLRGSKPSSQMLGKRLRQHLDRTIESSTLRRSLAALLVGAFDAARGDLGELEARVTDWVAQHLLATWVLMDATEVKEAAARAKAALDPPLNLDGTPPTPFRAHLREARAALDRRFPASGAPLAHGPSTRWTVKGEPIAGEDERHTAAWRARVALTAARRGVVAASAVSFAFTLTRGRRVDLDNLVRPALEGLQDAGVFSHGYPSLDELVAAKEFGSSPGLTIDVSPSTPVGPPGAADLHVEHPTLPGDDRRDLTAEWRDAVAATRVRRHSAEDVWVDVTVTGRRSLKDVMKPILDGLEPYLGRDPSGTTTFAPRDDRVVWLRLRRVQRGQALMVDAGPAMD